jgi:non-ribosomal peptide synthase protein (TIGR01720 family)
MEMGSADEARLEALSDEKRALLGQWVQLAVHMPAEAVLPETEPERNLAAIWCAVLHCDDVLASDSFLDLGGNSITSIQVVAKAAAIGIQVTARQVIEAANLRELASVANLVDEPVVDVESDSAVGQVALTPIQRWFFSQEFTEPHRWDQAVVVDLATRLDPDLLNAAMQAVVAHHDVLRSRFLRGDDGWTQVVGSVAAAAVHKVPIRSASRDHLDKAIAVAQRSIDITSGPLVAAVLLDGNGVGTSRLLLAVHHLVVDGVSMRILIEDLDTAYRSLRDGVAVSLPRRTSSFRSWSRELQRFAESDELTKQLPYWTSGLSQDGPIGGCGLPAESNLQRDCEVLSIELDAPLSQKILRDIPRHGACSVECLLIAGLAVTWQRERGVTTLALDLEGHGREPISTTIDVSRTVGWFTSIYPVRLVVPDGGELAGALACVADVLDGVPSRGVGYGVLRYLSTRGAELSRQGSRSISFNYLGSFVGPTDELCVLGAPVQLPMVLRSEHSQRPYVLEVAAADVCGRVVIKWEYAPGVMRRDMASALFAGYIAAIGELVEAALALPAGPRGENKFKLARISADELTAIRDRLARRRRS